MSNSWDPFNQTVRHLFYRTIEDIRIKIISALFHFSRNLQLLDFDKLSGSELKKRLDDLLRIKHSVLTELRYIEQVGNPTDSAPHFTYVDNGQFRFCLKNLGPSRKAEEKVFLG